MKKGSYSTKYLSVYNIILNFLGRLIALVSSPLPGSNPSQCVSLYSAQAFASHLRDFYRFSKLSNLLEQL